MNGPIITRAGLLAAAAAMAFGAPRVARAQPRNLRLVLPYAPGGVVDTLGRVLAQGLGEVTGGTVVADNRPGAGGMIGSDHVAKSTPDGSTALIMDPAIVINPSLQASVPYDLFRDLKPVAIISSSPLVCVVTPSLPIHSMQELLAYGRAHRGQLSFASAGVGTTPHLAGEMLNQRTGIDATHVPYRGIAASMPDVMSGKVQFTFSSIAGARGLLADGRLRGLITTGTRRPPALPDLPTAAEAGLADFNIDLWLGVFVPAATPDATVAAMNTAIQAVLAKPATAAAFGRAGAEVRHTTPAEAAAVLRREHDMWKALITSARITLG
ncbi:tripartite tricarboxylate transporter substrate binding protein [Falsiroseomonas selenitidurans]|uniref:Tripartite tricarboxylate transporter substrate binding protein n=1 Tax=Falsiroseomonas selenitidurans TaxID=2716335 RepID=A0ABX1E2Y2_9PROT|nr:tripartite tricarboxylate transporter substrate binding protein [Falsiroseomonas selenitidurans]NKC31398.1 tripartite tricarboxylate transporter substrate binding protein [Falsiroseomonas selenitidurans]